MRKLFDWFTGLLPWRRGAVHERGVPVFSGWVCPAHWTKEQVAEFAKKHPGETVIGSGEPVPLVRDRGDHFTVGEKSGR